MGRFLVYVSRERDHFRLIPQISVAVEFEESVKVLRPYEDFAPDLDRRHCLPAYELSEGVSADTGEICRFLNRHCDLFCHTYLLSAIDLISNELRYATFLHRYNTTFRNNVKQKATIKNNNKLHIAYILQKWYIVRER